MRNRFKHAQLSTSLRQLRFSFEAGYEAIDYLDAAIAGNEESKNYIVSLTERAPAKIKLRSESNAALKKDSKPVSRDASEETSQEQNISLLDRPVPLDKLSGKRHVPVLFSANHIPVLRIKKPQPENLSRYIRQRLTQRQSRHDRRWRLYEESALARREDEWDNLVAPLKEMSIADAMNGVNNEEPTWKVAVQDAIVEVETSLDEEKEKNRVMAEKMQAIVDREQELFEKERAEQKEAKKAKKMERRRQSGLEEPKEEMEAGRNESADSPG